MAECEIFHDDNNLELYNTDGQVAQELEKYGISSKAECDSRGEKYYRITYGTLEDPGYISFTVDNLDMPANEIRKKLYYRVLVDIAMKTDLSRETFEVYISNKIDGIKGEEDDKTTSSLASKISNTDFRYRDHFRTLTGYAEFDTERREVRTRTQEELQKYKDLVIIESSGEGKLGDFFIFLKDRGFKYNEENNVYVSEYREVIISFETDIQSGFPGVVKVEKSLIGRQLVDIEMFKNHFTRNGYRKN